MTDASMAGLFRRLAQGVHHQLAEWLRISSVYLGIAVIVTVSMGFALPGLRDQALQVHRALLTALAPESAMQFAADNDAVPSGDSAATVAMAVPDVSDSTVTTLPGSVRHAVGRPVNVAAIIPSGPQAQSLRSYISRKYKVAYNATETLVDTAFRVAHEKKLDPLLVLAVIAVESSYNPMAESAKGAQGLMQVMPRIHKDKFVNLAEQGRGNANPLDPVSNIIVGSTILRDCISQRGSVAAGLACYEGTSVDDGYAERVQAERRRLALASGMALSRNN
ncbi:lytic transglycosylase domain-containing protein [Bordetella sp. FB-8]|uniref:lytic transglycosylase domain-containing protein n=1 Tax=Bordetella sp. FB-8 TaxID=1159870 RepID=UPI0003A47A01|nr:lytic transglycosylase domain-containing protein [Bordetella sp. FB-8]